MALRIPNVCSEMMNESYVVPFGFVIEDGLCTLLAGMVMGERALLQLGRRLALQRSKTSVARRTDKTA